jgi:hypothetical protein
MIPFLVIIDYLKPLSPNQSHGLGAIHSNAHPATFRLGFCTLGVEKYLLS